MSGFEDPLYNSQYYSIAPSHPGPDDSHYAYNHHHGHGDPTTGMTSSWMGYPQSGVHDLGGEFQDLYSTAYSHAQEEPAMFGTGGPSTTTNTMYPAHGYPIQGSNIEGQFPNVDLSYDDSWSGVGTPMPMGLDATNPFAYNVSSAYPMPLPLTLPMGLNPQAAYSTSFPTQNPVQNTYWGMDHFHSTRQQDQTVAQGQQLQDSQIYSQPYAPTVAPTAAASNRSLQPRAIQPKKLSPLTDRFPSHVKPESRTQASPYTNIYSTSGFDILGVLARVISRPDPKINIGAVDLSCAFVLCDIIRHDHPIVYVSEAFERMTGYTSEEIVGRNCRFLQSPQGNLQRGMERKFVDPHTVTRLRTTIEERNEIQASIINYRKGGQPFMNLITMIPVRLGNEYRFYVGFQVDLVEKPDAITKKNQNGTYMINYKRHQLPNYVVPPPDVYRDHPDLAVQFGHAQVSAILQSISASRPEYKPYLDRILVENADDVIQVLSYDGSYLYLSPSCRRVLEYDSVELMGKTLSTICHPSDIGPVTRELRASTTTAPVSVVHRIRKKNSGYIWFESHGSWHVEQGRGRTFLVLVGRERPTYCVDQITRLGVEALAENDLWAKLSMSGMILYISTKSKPVLGQTADELIGTTFEDLVRVEDRPEAHKAFMRVRTGRSAMFHYLICHKKGHMLQAQTALFPGDTKEGIKPSFLIAQVRFPKFTQPATRVGGPEGPTDSASSLPGGGDQDSPNKPAPSGNRQKSTQPAVFPELAAARGSSWQFELREIEKRNRTLSDELHRLLTRRKKRKRKQIALPVGKNCATCQTSNTPEWRRGPSGNRDLCNSCGLRWAKQVRSTTQSEKSGSS